MLRTVIIDDEIPNLKLLERMLLKFESINLVNKYTSSSNLLKNIKTDQPEIVFLDIEMPKISGIELAEKILDLNINPIIIFVTAYNQYALEAFRVNALDYIVKPVNVDKISRVLSKIECISTISNQIKNSSMNSITTIECFGNFFIRNKDNKIITWATSHVEELFAYLLCHTKDPIDKWKLAELLWPESNPKSASTNIHTAIYRLKKTLSNNNIPIQVKRNNLGYWLELKNVKCDLHILEQLNTFILDEYPIHYLEDIFYNYHGRLFEKKGYVWSISLNNEYENKILDISYFLSSYYENNLDSVMQLKFLKTMLKIFPAEEFFVEKLMLIYRVHQNLKGICDTYMCHQDYLLEIYGLAPSQKITECYHKLLSE